MRIYKVLAIIALLGAVGCRKFVAIPPPTSQLVTASVFTNAAAATAAQTSIYSQMYRESYNISQNTGLLGDELKDYSGTGNNKLFYTNALTAVMSPGPWNNAYSYIYQANAVLEGLHNASGIGDAIKSQLSGEAKFIRAFWHFYLTNLYGLVPLVTSTSYSTNALAKQASQDKIYQQIIIDLQEAEASLNTNYVDGTDTTITSNRLRPTKWAALAFRARVYLYTKKYDSAIVASSAVIANTPMFSLVQDVNSVFRVNSQEAIWQLSIPQPNPYNTLGTFDELQYALISKPTNVALSFTLLNSFDSLDMRKKNWIGTFTTTTPAASYYFPQKYKTRLSTTNNESVMVLRLAEQILIRGEARCQNGDFENAIADLNMIRERAGLPDYGGPSNKDSILASIIHERKVEFFTEWGHRWLDMKRTNIINSVMGFPGNVSAIKGGTWSADGHQALYPIWQTEIRKDPNLTQNPGY